VAKIRAGSVPIVSGKTESGGRAPSGVSQADYEPPPGSRYDCGLRARAVKRPEDGVKPQNGNAFKQIDRNIEQEKGGRGLTKAVIGQSGEIPAEYGGDHGA
jgi:hypothetical protein